MCVSVQIPEFLGCLSGSAIYLETNNNFFEKRINGIFHNLNSVSKSNAEFEQRIWRLNLEIHSTVIEHCLTITKNQTLSKEENLTLHKFVTTDPLLGIQKYSISTVEELRASVYVIEKMLDESRNVSIIY